MSVPILAVCKRCHLKFSSGIALTPGASIDLQGIWSECPRCGSPAYIPNGTYGYAKRTLDQIARADAPIDKVPILIVTLKTIERRYADIDADDIRIALEKAEIPNAEEIANSAPQGKDDKKTWLGILIVAITYAWEHLPQGALSWIEFFEKVKELFP